MSLSEADAISLSAELVDIAVKIRTLEAKYNIKGNGAGVDLGGALLSALRPHAGAAQVAAYVQIAGLSLVNPSSSTTEELDRPSKHGPPPSIASTFATPKQVLGPSGYGTDPWQRQLSGPAAFTRQVSPGSQPFSDLQAAIAWRKQISQDSDASSWQRQISDDSMVDFLGGRRKITLEPASSNTLEKWSLTIEVARDGEVRHMRKVMARSLKLPLGKIRLIDGTDAGEGDFGKFLGDTEPSAKANWMHIANLSKSPAPSGNAKKLTRDVALTLQREILAELNAPCRRGRLASNPKECLAEAQAQVLPRHGFLAPSLNASEAALSSLATILHAFDKLALDLEVAEAGDAINEKLGYRPQLYAIREATFAEEDGEEENIIPKMCV